MRLIDADALIKKMVHPEIEINDGQDFADWYMQCVKEAPTKDVEPVRYGRWVKPHGMMPPEYHHRNRCSLCGSWAYQDFYGRERLSLYCPHCGAKMRGDSDAE